MYVNVVQLSPEARRGGPTYYIRRTGMEFVVAGVKGSDMEPGKTDDFGH